MAFPLPFKKPEIIHSVYTDRTVIMPSCAGTVLFTGKCAKAVLQAKETGGFIGIIQKQYRQSRVKRGCLTKIRSVEQLDETVVQVLAEGICRFDSDDYYFIKGYDFEQIVVNYKAYENDSGFNQALIEFEKINPIFMQYFLSFVVDLTHGSPSLLIEGATMEKFINSLIMIMPIKQEERIFLSELTSLDERQNALAFLLNVKEKSKAFTLPETKN